MAILKTQFRRLILTLALLALALPSLAALPSTFVDTAGLAAIGDKAVVVDVRNAALYLVGHVKGALQISRDDFLETRRGVKGLIPTPAAWEELLSKNGISPSDTVVVYAESKDPYAARLVWSLRYYGHANAFVLDGGYEKWRSEGRPTELGLATARARTSYRIAGGAPIRAEADTVLTRLNSPTTLVWDSRSKGEYLGTDVRADRGGHVPGATHLEWTELQREVDGAKVLRSEEEIRSLLKANGIVEEKEVFPYCQTGIRSAYATLVLLGYGYKNARNYDGSWTEWGNDKALPLESGAGQTN